MDAATKSDAQTIAEFWQKTQKASAHQCWIWTGAVDRKGYGKLRHKQRLVFAHRFSYQLAFGLFDEKLCVLHHCDTPACVNPSHLFLGTAADNIHDMDAKGRRVVVAPRGEHHVCAKLTAEDVLEIRRRKAAGESYHTLASMFGVKPGQIYNICARQCWKHLD